MRARSSAFHWSVWIWCVAAAALAACGGGAQEPAAAPSGGVEPVAIRLPMGYIPSVQYAPFYVAADKGYYREAGFEVTFDYSPEVDGVALVGANQLPFTLASGEQVVLARSQGLPVVYVMAWWQQYPVAVAALKDQKIQSPAGLKGKKIGVPLLSGASYIGLRALLSAGGLKETDVTIDAIGFTQVEALVTGQEDAVVVYANNEPIQLEARGYPVDVLNVSDYVPLASNGLISNESQIAGRPEQVRAFVQATLKGLADVLADPQEAFEICRRYVEGLDQNEAIQRQVLARSIEFWQTDHPGVSDPQAWENMQTVLQEIGLVSSPLDLAAAYTNRFVQAEP